MKMTPNFLPYLSAMYAYNGTPQDAAMFMELAIQPTVVSDNGVPVGDESDSRIFEVGDIQPHSIP